MTGCWAGEVRDTFSPCVVDLYPKCPPRDYLCLEKFQWVAPLFESVVTDFLDTDTHPPELCNSKDQQFPDTHLQSRWSGVVVAVGSFH